MMKKIMFGLLGMLSIHIGLAQEQLSVATGGSVYISKGDFVHVGGNVALLGGTITADSDDAESASLLYHGTATAAPSSGGMTYKRYTNLTGTGTVTNTDWAIFSNPVTGLTAGAFITENDSELLTSSGKRSIGKYVNTNPVTTRWEYFADGSIEVLVNGGGYTAKRNGGAGTLSFTGGLPAGNANSSITFSGGSATHGWEAIGNPYTASMLLLNVAQDAGFYDKLATDAVTATGYDAIYFWDGSVYVPFNNATAPGADQYLLPGQGFMVKFKDAAQTVVFEEALRSHQTAASTYLRPVAVPELVLSLSNGTKTKQTTVKYFSNTTTGLDARYDAGALEASSAFTINTHLLANNNGIDFTLQCLPDADYESMVIPVSVNAVANVAISFSAAATNLPSGIKVFLEDKQTGTFTNISETAYSVTPTENVAGIGRFYIHTKASVLGLDDQALLNRVSIYKTANTTLRVTGISEGASHIKMYSILGQQVVNHRFTAQQVNDIALPSSLATGIYVVDLATVDGTVSKKIIIE